MATPTTIGPRTAPSAREKPKSPESAPSAPAGVIPARIPYGSVITTAPARAMNGRPMRNESSDESPAPTSRPTP